jgi:hypothetical protein
MNRRLLNHKMDLERDISTLEKARLVYVGETIDGDYIRDKEV